MKVQTLETEVVLGFDLKGGELRTAARRVENQHRNDRKVGRGREVLRIPYREIHLTKSGPINHRTIHHEEFPAYKYVATVHYSPPVDLTFELVGHDLMYLNELTTLPLYNASVQVTPSQLKIFKRPWSYSLAYPSWSRNEEPPEQGCSVELSITGASNVDKVYDELRDMVDNLYAPYPEGKGWNTELEGGSTGGPLPTIVVNKWFPGDTTPETESQIDSFYNQILEFVLRTRITEDFVTDYWVPEGQTLADFVKEVEGADLHEHIASSTAGQNRTYAPNLKIEAYTPLGNIRPELFPEGKNYVLKNTMTLVVLTTLADSVSTAHKPYSQ